MQLLEHLAQAVLLVHQELKELQEHQEQVVRMQLLEHQGFQGQ
jgi:hypothetical protein